MDRGTTLALDDCMAGHTLEVERRDDGVLLVRVRSDQMTQEPLPDAVFSFRAGDPQYSYWLQWLLNANPACDAKPAG
jgi:hypothetical protein